MAKMIEELQALAPHLATKLTHERLGFVRQLTRLARALQEIKAALDKGNAATASEIVDAVFEEDAAILEEPKTDGQAP